MNTIFAQAGVGKGGNIAEISPVKFTDLLTGVVCLSTKADIDVMFKIFNK